MSRRDEARHMLRNWGRWLVEGGSVGQGYPRKAAFWMTSARSTADGGSHLPINDLDASKVNGWVDGLRAVKDERYMVVYCLNVGNPTVPSRRRCPLSVGDAAKELGRSKSWIYDNQDSACDALMHWWHAPKT